MSRFDWYNKQREYTTHSHKNCGWNGIKPCFLLDKNRRQIGKKFTRFKRKPTRIRLRRCGLCISRDSAMYLSSSLQDENWEPKKEYNREPRTPRHNASEFMGASNPALQFPDFTVILLVFWQFCNELEPTVQYNRSARRTNVSPGLHHCCRTMKISSTTYGYLAKLHGNVLFCQRGEHLLLHQFNLVISFQSKFALASHTVISQLNETVLWGKNIKAKKGKQMKMICIYKYKNLAIKAKNLALWY